MASKLARMPSLPVATSSSSIHTKLLREALEKAKKNGGVVVVDSLTSSNPQVIAVESNYTSQDDSGDGDGDQHLVTAAAAHTCKKPRADGDTDDVETSLKDVLKNIHKAIILRLDSLDKKLDALGIQCEFMEEKVETMSQHLIANGIKIDEVSETSNRVSLDGSWLGDESNPEMRVRCPIVPEDLRTLDTACRTPEKMALTLLDYLFDRETQACSNISGHGKHGKKQLDPLMIYGIKCHLMHKFIITERDWLRIKVNLDSKCRTAFRRKLKGMPLTVKAFRDKLPLSCSLQMANSNSQDYNQNVGHNSNSDGKESTPLHASCPTRQENVPIPAHSGSLNNGHGRGLHSRHAQNSAQVIFSQGGELDMVDQRFDSTNVVNATMVGLDDKEALVDLVEGQGVEMGFGLDSIAVSIDPHSQIIHTMQGDIQVVHATPEQLAEIQRTGKIQILTENHFLHEVQDVLNLSRSTPHSTSTANNVDLNTCSILEADKMDISSPVLPSSGLVDLKNETESV